MDKSKVFLKKVMTLLQDYRTFFHVKIWCKTSSLSKLTIFSRKNPMYATYLSTQNNPTNRITYIPVFPPVMTTILPSNLWTISHLFPWLQFLKKYTPAATTPHRA